MLNFKKKIMEEFKWKELTNRNNSFTEKTKDGSFLDRIYILLFDDGVEINYGDFMAKCHVNGFVKVAKSLGIYKTIGARSTKKTFIHPKLLLAIKTIIARHDVIAKTVVELVDGKYLEIEKFECKNYDDYNKLNSEYPINESSGHCTYIIYNPKSRLYKIGKSKKILKRLYEIQNLFSSECVLYGYLEKDIELKLHNEYKLKRITGEWFDLNNDDLNQIKNVFLFKTETNNL